MSENTWNFQKNLFSFNVTVTAQPISSIKNQNKQNLICWFSLISKDYGLTYTFYDFVFLIHQPTHFHLIISQRRLLHCILLMITGFVSVNWHFMNME